MLSIRQSIVKLFLLAASVGAHKSIVNEMSHEDHQQQQDQAPLLDSRELENEWPRKNIGRYGRKFRRVIDKDLKELQGIIIDEERGTSVYDVLLESQTINGLDSASTSQANGLMFAYDPTVSSFRSPPFSDGAYAYQGCEKEEFGEDGKFNDVVCDTLDTMNDLCMKEEACNKNVTTNVMVADPNVYKDLNIITRLSCLAAALLGEVDPPICFSPDIADLPEKYGLAVAGLQNLITYAVPNGYENRVLSYGIQMMADVPGFENTDTVNGVIGKSYFDMFEDFNPKFATLRLKSVVVWFTAASYFPQEVQAKKYSLHAVQGYLMFKYSKSILTNDERKVWKKYILQVDEISYCSVLYGIKHAVDCKTMDELVEVLDEDGFGGEDPYCAKDDSLNLYYEVKQLLRKKSSYWNKNCAA